MNFSYFVHQKNLVQLLLKKNDNGFLCRPFIPGTVFVFSTLDSGVLAALILWRINLIRLVGLVSRAQKSYENKTIG